MPTEELNREQETHRVAASGDLEVSTYLEIAKELGGEQPAPAEAAAVKRETIIVIDFGLLLIQF